MQAIPEISAVILNYKDPDLTGQCVQVLSAAFLEARVLGEIIIVDNSGPETGAELARNLGHCCEIILNGSNRGFSAACNQGIAAARAPYVLAINNDAFATAECLSAGIAYLSGNPDTGIWAPGLVFGNGQFQPSTGRTPTLATHFAEYLLPARFSARPDPSQEICRDVDTVTGAFMLFRKEAFDRVRGFDEDFFFTVEDIDLCVRMHECGFRVVYDPGIRVVHLGGSSQSWKWNHDPHLHKSRILYFSKRHGPLTGSLARIIVEAGLGLRKLMARERDEP
ncbi:MAG: glycosyltransferase family 2 protein [Rectinemataceae bacterium]